MAVGKRKHVEMSQQRELVKWLHIEHPDVEITYRKNEGNKAIIEAVLDKLAGLAAGVPDLQLVLNYKGWSYFLELELKKLKGKLNEAQKEWHKNFKPTKNRKAAIAYGFAEMKQIIEDWINEIKKN